MFHEISITLYVYYVLRYSNLVATLSDCLNLVKPKKHMEPYIFYQQKVLALTLEGKECHYLTITDPCHAEK